MGANLGVALLFALNRNRLLLYQLLESCQLVSFMVYLDIRLPSNINGLLELYYNTNFATLIPNPFKGISEKEK